MIMGSRLGLLLRSFLFLSFVSISCAPEFVDDPIPYVPFDDVILDLSLPENQGLNAQGIIDLSVRYPNAGVRGILLYKKNSTTYIALEKNCSLSPAEACATVEIHSSLLYLHDPCCGSSFNFEGAVTGGPAVRPLRQYQTYLSGNTLTITDGVVG